MATAIRPIPTLHGKEAEDFLRAAEAVEANPGRITINRRQVESVRRMMAQAQML